MKIYSYLLLGAMFLLGGCSDLLDIDPKNKIPADELFSTPIPGKNVAGMSLPKERKKVSLRFSLNSTKIFWYLFLLHRHLSLGFLVMWRVLQLS